MTYLRKKPRQARSRVTCAAIVEAVARILSEEGAKRLTTSRIAERAGVSVGYQYFSNRQAIVRAARQPLPGWSDLCNSPTRDRTAR